MGEVDRRQERIAAGGGRAKQAQMPARRRRYAGKDAGGTPAVPDAGGGACATKTLTPTLSHRERGFP